MKKWICFVTTLIVYFFIHEGLHAVIAEITGEYKGFLLHWYGPEVIFTTPVIERSNDLKWFYISGISNIVTITIGYILFLNKGFILSMKNDFIKVTLYYITVLFLLLDAFNLSIGYLLYGGDANGIAVGLNVSVWVIVIISVLFLLINRELTSRFIQYFGIKTNNVIFKPWLTKK